MAEESRKEQTAPPAEQSQQRPATRAAETATPQQGGRAAPPARQTTQKAAPPARPHPNDADADFALRLPYDHRYARTYGVTIDVWRTLTEIVWPSARTASSVLLALQYCRARKLDPLKRVVHIVPIYDSQRQRYVETVVPGIGEIRTTALRTGLCAGREETKWGPEIVVDLGGVAMTVPEWASVTVYRFCHGHRVPFVGPRCYFTESVMTDRDGKPNTVWRKRPRGQLEKCAEAAAWRAAFPEELGDTVSAEEVNEAAIPEVLPPPPPQQSQAERVAEKMDQKAWKFQVEDQPQGQGKEELFDDDHTIPF